MTTSLSVQPSIFARPKLFVSSTALFLMSGLGSMIVNELPASPKEFSCGGGPFSFLMASLVSTTCNRDMIHLCCEAHDRCYDQRHLNQTFCDQVFCGCLTQISSSAYCDNIAQPSLCLATEVFGHLFHWSAYANKTEVLGAGKNTSLSLRRVNERKIELPFRLHQAEKKLSVLSSQSLNTGDGTRLNNKENSTLADKALN